MKNLIIKNRHYLLFAYALFLITFLAQTKVVAQSFKANQHTVFNGLGLAVVRSTLKPGQISVLAESEGLISNKIIISIN
ncbi:MAG: hypothetical protein GXO85_12115 [Chlorobi bacterium]|nr:hypothetical protein [Chlorobiota bacterium]